MSIFASKKELSKCRENTKRTIDELNAKIIEYHWTEEWVRKNWPGDTGLLNDVLGKKFMPELETQIQKKSQQLLKEIARLQKLDRKLGNDEAKLFQEENSKELTPTNRP